MNPIVASAIIALVGVVVNILGLIWIARKPLEQVHSALNGTREEVMRRLAALEKDIAFVQGALSKHDLRVNGKEK